MRIISSEELDLISGGTPAGYEPPKLTDGGGSSSIWGAVVSFVSGLFGGGSASSNSCVPSSSSSGGTMTTQTCGAGGVSTSTTTGPGYFNQVTTTPNPAVSVSGSYGPGNIKGEYSAGFTVTTTSCINGRCTTTSSSQP
jgi:hypothetical protein